MNLKYNIKSVSDAATMPYLPTTLELWLSETKTSVPDVMPPVAEGDPIPEQTFTDYISVQSETNQALHNGNCKVTRNFFLPAASLQAMITGYEVGGAATINLPMLDGYLKAYHEIQLV